MTYALRINPGTKVSLRAIDAAEKGPFEGKNDPRARKCLRADLARLGVLQERLYAENKRALLVVFQAMDAGGKDGALRHVVGPLDSRSCNVVGFVAPTAEELAHDFLWRVHARTPRQGTVTFFNRSHYEDVLVARVMGLVPRAVWRRRYEHINAFERSLSDSGTTIVKIFLHISKAEQKRRLEERLADPEKRWKFDPSDLAARERWGAYRKAYEDALSACSTRRAPWYVVPADHKWYRNLAVARLLVETLEHMGPKTPPPRIDIASFTIR